MRFICWDVENSEHPDSVVSSYPYVRWLSTGLIGRRQVMVMYCSSLPFSLVSLLMTLVDLGRWLEMVFFLLMP